MVTRSPLFKLPNLDGRRLILASMSPRRRTLLSDLALKFEIAPTIDVDESYPPDLAAHEVAPYLSRLKADAYTTDLDDSSILITADTVVVSHGKILGKPRDREAAKVMLRTLSGNTHTVITGVTLTSAKKQVSFSAETSVEFAILTEEEIDFYVNSFSPTDKAGAYGIQEWIGCIGVKSITGSFYNVMGLPLHRLYDELKRF